MPAMWGKLGIASCLTSLVALVVIAAASVLAAVTHWRVDYVRGVAAIALFLSLCVMVSLWFLAPQVDPKEEQAKHGNAPDAKAIARLEAALGVTVPADYKRLMLDFPVRFERGNRESRVWNDVDALIARNKKLRSGKRPWPSQYLFIGDDGGGTYFALDLAHATPSVAAFGEGRDPGRGDAPPEHTTLDTLVAEMEEAAHEDGLDPHADEQPPAESFPRRLRGCLIFWAVILAIAVGIGALGAWSGCSKAP
jgi:hypothetical protein